ncbi:SDR family NAD(P)-dependent oxidoreductase [Cuneatibacter caecimuris]|uniref:NAD(P)-dependent dehydrogenase (Short-subunit alcohol dehydrogenase family) n=1 Tax=Cuneatibacter caecimuris TaxID=1796618 RepID=A0A4Q7NZX1_9FIRM|nr:SDR family oxidoreductase [Cuneatibacter caecimuris]RZS93056.1 NAD(P)-dependent dehydrogenase (short-subunit alcohol dehydrogenase family) [Cuneatibacter caecimuris]
MNRLAGKVAIITGGNSGIGAAAAKIFAAEGASVVISARREAQLKEVADSIEAAGGKVLAVPTDISKPEDAAHLVQAAVDAFGKVDVLVNNAGVLEEGLKAIDKFENEDLDYVFHINTAGTMNCMKEALKVMKGNGGSIVNVTSVAGVIGNGGASYVASKAAMNGVTRHTAMRFASDNIRCNAVCPGTVLTPMTAGMSAAAGNLDMELMGAMSAHADMKRPPCQPEDVANILVFLASDESRAITGQTIVCDFGATL